MGIVKKKVAQVAIEVLVIMGILVIGSIVLGMTYINNQNKTIKLSQEVTIAQDDAIDDLRYTEGFNPDNPAVCGNGMCEPGENYSDCLIDCHCGDGNCDVIPYGETPSNCPIDCSESLPPVEQNCNFVSTPTFSPSGGSLTPVSTITISHYNNTNCKNFRRYYTYTTNNSEPTNPTRDSNNYLSQILVSSLVTPSEGSSATLKIKAIVYADSQDGDGPNDVNSLVASVTYTVTNPYCFSGSGSGDGSAENPIIICTLKELNDVRNKLDAYYILGKDLDLSAEAFAAEGIEYNPETGWEPIGKEDDPFTGSFDGNGHKLSKLFINREDDVGFFGYVNEGNINNLYLVDSDIKANNYSGVLAGHSENSEINNCSTTGNLVGNNFLGGLIGYSSNSGITESVSFVSINGNENTGGFIGVSKESIISDCFSRGEVSAQSDFAGFIGVVEKGEINNSYSTGLVKKKTGGAVKNAGLIKKNSDCAINSSYWDTETSLQDTSDGGEGRTTEEMINIDNYQDWDFDSIWKIDSSINDGYPFLQKNYN
ncbi:MAG: hypothetical protein WC108_08005 [Bacteroidales bacterium]